MRLPVRRQSRRFAGQRNPTPRKVAMPIKSSNPPTSNLPTTPSSFHFVDAMPRQSTSKPSSLRTSAYSLRTLSRPSSVVQKPPSVLDSKQFIEEHTRDEFLPQDVDRYDRMWGEMAARMGDLDTLITAPSTDLRLVSEAHAKCVEQLRDSQIRLAETWAGSESRLGESQSSLLAKLANSAAGYILIKLG